MSSTYTPTIGLEIHAELKTATKMFCNSANDPEETKPNTHVCPVCMAHPGSLPVVNREAVRHVLRVGAAVNGTLADYTEFDRKNYFYPDIPKGYQISQFEYPLVKGGELAGVQLTRIHLEEDTATSKHGTGESLVDFNRAGVPLMELVTEPVIHDAETASRFAKELQLLLRTLGAGEANMEKGQMRVEVNISVSKDATLGTKAEIKNISSFKAVERAIAYEIERQVSVLESGGTLVQETRGFNEDTGQTFSQRLKESSHDYRYFPDPDIPKLQVSLLPDLAEHVLKASLPELPSARRARYAQLGVQDSDVETLVSDPVFQEFFESEILARLEAGDIRLGVNYLLTDVRAHYATGVTLDNLRGGAFAEVITLVSSKAVSSRGAKDLIAKVLADGGSPKVAAADLGLMQNSDAGEITRLAEKLIQDNPKVVSEIQAGKGDAIKFLVGQGMKESKGKANPELLLSSLKALLNT